MRQLKWCMYFIHGLFFYMLCVLVGFLDFLFVTADIAYENDKFIDELDPDFVDKEIDKRMYGEDGE